jgi:hypothetical protein
MWSPHGDVHWQVSLHDVASMYPWNSNWGNYNTLLQIAQSPYFQQLFALPFSSFILTSYSVTGLNDNYWINGVRAATLSGLCPSPVVPHPKVVP